MSKAVADFLCGAHKQRFIRLTSFQILHLTSDAKKNLNSLEEKKISCFMAAFIWLFVQTKIIHKMTDIMIYYMKNSR